MVNTTSIQQAFAGLVGWRQPLDPAYAIVDADNLLSSSGQYFQDISALVKVETLRNCVNYNDLTDEEFNDILRNIYTSAINKIMNALFYDNDLISNNLLFDYECDWTHKLTPSTAFVGYEIDVADSNKMTTIINNVKLSFDGVDDVKLLLFHSSKKNPIKTINISTVENDEVESVINWELSHANNKSGGKYYLGYLTSYLTASAYDRLFESANIQNCFNLCRFTSMIVPEWDSETLFDVNNKEYASFTWGLNFDISEYHDFTSLVLSNKNRFVNILMLQVAAEVIDLIIHSDRINGVEANATSKALWELNGSYFNPEMPKVVGIIPKLKAELAELKSTLFKKQKIQIDTIK